MNRPHTHRVQSSIERCYFAPVAVSYARQNAAAHGNICVIDTCKCGATRRTNVNGRHTERGAWVAPTPGFDDGDDV